jgi:hypothetical protein
VSYFAQIVEMVMLIGLDFDNTIACYDRAFAIAVQDLGLVPRGEILCKADVKKRLQAQAGGELNWRRLQGQVYTRYITLAYPFEGFAAFVKRARTAQVALKIVSHKTRHGHFEPERIDMREAARSWMAQQGFFDNRSLGFQSSDIHFLSTAEAKLATIGALGCTVFIDDLPSILQHTAFPASTRGMLFAPGGYDGNLTAFLSWADIARELLP